MDNKIIAPSLLAADFSNLDNFITDLNNSKAEWLHIDVMDGQFVPNLTFGSKVIKTLRPKTNKFFDVHMMVNNPSNHIESLVNAGADQITVHLEACDHLHTTLEKIKSYNIKAGITLKPDTKIVKLLDYLTEVDHVLLMSVEPGFGGQKFLPQSIERLQELVKLRKDLSLDFTIAVDGGVDAENVKQLSILGADALVMGSALMKKGDMIKNIDIVKSFLS